MRNNLSRSFIGLGLLWIAIQTSTAQSNTPRMYTNDGSTTNSTQEEGAKTTTTDYPEFKIQRWQISEDLGEIIPVTMDTLSINFHALNHPDGTSDPRQNNATRGLPSLDRLFFLRKPTPQFLFRNVFEQEYIQPGMINYYRTTIPYAHLSYSSAGGQANLEEEFKALFTMNAGKRINVGGFVNLLSAKGFYSFQAANSISYDFWGSYTGDRYAAHFSIISNNLSNQENGGITDDRYITNPVEMGEGRRTIEPKNIPTHLQDAYTRVKGLDIHFSHRFNLGFDRLIPKDSTNKDTISEFIPVSSIIHTAKVTTGSKMFIEKQAPVTKGYFANTYLDPAISRDSTTFLSVTNTLALSLREGFNKYAAFGLTGYIQHEYRQFTLLNPYSSSWSKMTDEMRTKIPSGYELGQSRPESQQLYYGQQSVYVGGVMNRTQGKIFNFNVNGKVGILGYDAGLVDLNGTLQTTFPLGKENALIAAEAYFRNSPVQFYMNNYVSNHFIWKNNFNHEQRLRIAGKIKLDRINTYVRGGVESIQNYIYFDEAGPNQESSNLQVIFVQGGKLFNFGHFHLDTHASFQLSSMPSVLSLPSLTAYANLYYEGAIAKVLKTQIGIDAQYFTDYKAPYYQPALNQFVTQNSKYIGNYPIVNVYANFHLKRTRFFVSYYHANQGLFGGNKYFSSPSVPINPAVLKIGLSWSFLD